MKNIGHSDRLNDLDPAQRYCLWQWSCIDRAYPDWLGISAPRKGAKMRERGIPKLIEKKSRTAEPVFIFRAGFNPNQ